MDIRAKAEELAKRHYLNMTLAETTTDGLPIFFARVLEVEGCFGQGDTQEAAIEDLRLALADLIESLLEDGLPVPETTQLIHSTHDRASYTVFTFVMQGKKLQLKQDEAYRDAYFLSAQAW